MGQENNGQGAEIEISIEGDYEIVPYGKLPDNSLFTNAEEYRTLLSEYFSAEVVERFMSNVTTAAEVRRTDEKSYNIDAHQGRIYVQPTDGDEWLRKYVDIDGVMYQADGTHTSGTSGVFAYSKIISKTEDEIVFAYPIKQDYISELVLTGTAVGKLVKENGTWKFGWFIGEDNVTEKYDDIWFK